MKRQLATGVMSSSIPPVVMGETRPCRVRTLLMKHLNRAKVVIVAASLVRHVDTIVVEVELVSVTDRLLKMAARSSHRE